MNASVVPDPAESPSPKVPELGSAVAGGSTVGSEITAGLIGLGVALGCVLPPLIHLVTGPLGAFIGGFVAANRTKPGARGRAIIACTIGTGLAGIIGLAAKIFVSLAGPSELPRWFPSNGTLVVVLGVVWLYGTALGAVGTVVSGALARRETKGVSTTDDQARSVR